MRALVLACLVLLAGCIDRVRTEGFAAPSPTSFVYTARTSTLMTANDDGAAERLRRDWLADALKAHNMCASGYVVDTRRLVPHPSPSRNDADIVYSGRCL
jgi:hypothetical protein